MPPEAAFDLSIRHHAGWLLARVSGDLDLATAPRVVAAFDDHPDRHVALELSDVRFIDSTGAEALERLRSERTVALVAPSGVVRRLLALTELTDEFEIVDDLDELESVT